MTGVLRIILIFVGASAALMADGALNVPEIDAGSAVTALALLSGGLLVFKARRRP